jgi:hypothetical protein
VSLAQVLLRQLHHLLLLWAACCSAIPLAPGLHVQLLQLQLQLQQ